MSTNTTASERGLGRSVRGCRPRWRSRLSGIRRTLFCASMGRHCLALQARELASASLVTSLERARLASEGASRRSRRRLASCTSRLLARSSSWRLCLIHSSSSSSARPRLRSCASPGAFLSPHSPTSSPDLARSSYAEQSPLERRQGYLTSLPNGRRRPTGQLGPPAMALTRVPPHDGRVPPDGRPGPRLLLLQPLLRQTQQQCHPPYADDVCQRRHARGRRGEGTQVRSPLSLS